MGALDNGPWYIELDRSEGGEEARLVGIQSEDFTHDVLLFVTGDFSSEAERIEYARELANKLNFISKNF